MEAETCGDDLIQLRFFLRDPGLILNSTQRLPELQQALAPTQPDRPGSNVAMICLTLCGDDSEFATRDQVVSTPSKSELVIGWPSSSLKYSFRAPRRGGLPTPWLLCMLRLAAAISVYAFPRSGLKPPASKTVRPVGSNGRFRFEKKNGDVFQTSRVGLPGFDESQLFRKTLWIGRRRESFPRQNRRRGVMAVRLVIVRTETRDDHIRAKFRMTQTMSARILSRSQMRNVSSAVLEKPKSTARVKNCWA